MVKKIQNEKHDAAMAPRDMGVSEKKTKGVSPFIKGMADKIGTRAALRVIAEFKTGLHDGDLVKEMRKNIEFDRSVPDTIGFKQCQATLNSDFVTACLHVIIEEGLNAIKSNPNTLHQKVSDLMGEDFVVGTCTEHEPVVQYDMPAEFLVDYYTDLANQFVSRADDAFFDK